MRPEEQHGAAERRAPDHRRGNPDRRAATAPQRVVARLAALQALPPGPLRPGGAGDPDPPRALPRTLRPLRSLCAVPRDARPGTILGASPGDGRDRPRPAQPDHLWLADR